VIVEDDTIKKRKGVKKKVLMLLIRDRYPPETASWRNMTDYLTAHLIPIPKHSLWHRYPHLPYRIICDLVILTRER